MKIVLGAGSVPNKYMLIGEAPGRVEARTEIPFSGPSGKKLDEYLTYSTLPSLKSIYRTNVVKVYQENNPDPTPQQILDWTPALLAEIEEVKPKFILAVGRYAAQWFLGEDCPSLDILHGMAHRISDCPRKDLPECVRGSILIPVFHPAGGLWNYERRSTIRYGYELAALTNDRYRRGLDIHYRYDPFAGRENYQDVTGAQLESILSSQHAKRDIIGLDTEGIPSDPWSIQISLDPGSGYLLRVSQPDFRQGIEGIDRYLGRNRPLIAMHQASTPVCSCYDVVMCRAMGLELQWLPWFDTMYNSYLYRLESQANKTLCERWQGMEMEDYESTIGSIGRDKQIQWLIRAEEISKYYPKPNPRHEKLNDGTVKTTQPKRISASISAILRDIEEAKETKEGLTDPFKRWKGLRESNPVQVARVESEIGRMVTGTLNDIPLERATYYACRDSDGTLRNALTFMQRNDTRISALMSEGMRHLPIVERMQSNGMPVSISRISALHSEMQEELDRLNEKISYTYWEGKPFNPKSPPMVASLCRRLGIKPAIRTKTGSASTSKKSIEEYRYTVPAIADVFDFRERQHNRDTYCNDVLSRVPEGYNSDILVIHSNFRPTKIPTRRLAASDPNILGIPTRTELGRKVRHCYIAPPSKIFCGYDLSGVEVRCLAHLSRDPLWINAFRSRINPHKDTASRLFKVPIGEVTDLQKAVAKTVNFLIIYGGGASNLYDQLRSNNIKGYDLAACRDLIRDWFRTYQGVDEYRRRVIREAKQTEISIDHWGMARYLPGINSGDDQIEGEEGRAAVSQKVQGLARGMLIKSTVWLDYRLQTLISAGEIDPQCQRLDVHDELVFLVNEGEQEILEPLVLTALTKHAGIELIVPIEAEAHYGYTWGEIK